MIGERTQPRAHGAPSETAMDVVVTVLERAGVRHLFGVPGGTLLPLYQALAARGVIRPILAKHEEGGAFMADGFARVSRSLCVCRGIAGPGATHAVTGVANAHADSVPLLLLSSQVATSTI